MNDPGQFILAIDQSTSATKGYLFDHRGQAVYNASFEHRQYYPQQGFVEHNPSEILSNTVRAIETLVEESHIGPDEIDCLAITNQRETAMIWDRETGEPVYNAIVWQCQRGAGYCRELMEKGYVPVVSEKTGLLIDPYFSASKLHWIIKSRPELKEKAENGRLLLGTMDSWLLWKLTGGKVHATDYSNACRTMLFNIHTLEWDEELIELFGLHRNMFPEVKYSDEIFGYTDPDIISIVGVPISGIMGDSHAALFGQQCFSPGMGKATYGTGSSVMMNIGQVPHDPPEGLVVSIGYGLKRQIHYVLEGNIHATGDTVSWLKNELELIGSAGEAEQLATGISDNGGVYLVPAFAGLGAPYWDNEARACISGMSRNTSKAHIARAALESIAYQIKDLVAVMESRGEIRLHELRVDGGPTRNRFLMQFQADMLGRNVFRSEIPEVSALGSTYMAGLATGFWKGLKEVAGLKTAGTVFEPSLEKEEVERLYSGWSKAVERARL